MGSNELKRELSRLSGVDFFNPKYRELFKKYFPGDKDSEDEKLKKTGVADEEKSRRRSRTLTKPRTNGRSTRSNEKKRAPLKNATKKRKRNVGKRRKSARKSTNSKEIRRRICCWKRRLRTPFLRGGVREEKLGPAMRLAKSEIGSLEELGKVEDILKDFPEWVHGYKPSKGFGMDVDNGSDNLSEEEKRLKQMGINPRD